MIFEGVRTHSHVSGPAHESIASASNINGPAHEMLVNRICSNTSNKRPDDNSSKFSGISFGPSLRLHPYFVYTGNEGSGVSAPMRYIPGCPYIYALVNIYFAEHTLNS